MSQYAYSAIDLQETLPTDPHLKIGRLQNGLTYYLKKNATPKNKVELRLVVKFGSLDEEDGQQGAAHFIEHLAFKNTQHFKNNTLRSRLETIGLKYGPDLNAFTDFDVTRYELSLPDNKKEHLQVGLQVLADFAGGVEIRANDIAGEENVIVEEQRLRNNLEYRKTYASYRQVMQGTRYPQRFPIGLDAVRKGFTASMLQQLYRKKYRPDQMALIVVGDVDTVNIEQQIIQLFSAQKNPTNSPLETQTLSTALPVYAEPTLMVLTDAEQSGHQIELTYGVHDLTPVVTVADLRQEMVKNYALRMMRNRLATYSTSYARAGGFEADFLRNKQKESVHFEFSKGGSDAAIGAIVEKIFQIQQFGFLESELQEDRKFKMNQFEQTYLERNKLESRYFVDRYVENFLLSEILGSPEQNWALMQALHPTITLAEINQLAKTQFSLDRPVQIMYVGPQEDVASIPSKVNLLASIDAAKQKKIEAPSVRAALKSLIKTPPLSAGTIVSEIDNQVHGTTEMKLSNGITVILKKTDFTNGQVRMLHQHDGGTSMFDHNAVLHAAYSPLLTMKMGFDDLPPRDVQEFLQPKSATLDISVTPYVARIVGVSAVNDLEVLFQWNYQRLTNSSRNKVLFKFAVDDLRRDLLKMMEQPEFIAQDQFLKLNFNDDPAVIFLPRFQEVEDLKMDKAIAAFDQLNQNFFGSYFVFVGNFEMDAMRPLVRKYLASLPSNKNVSSREARYPVAVRGVVKKTIFVGKEEKANLTLGFSGAISFTNEEALRATLMVNLLELRISQVLREEKSLIYASQVGFDLNPLQGGRYQISFQLPCAPDQVDAVERALFQEIRQLQERPATAVELAKVKKAWAQSHKALLRSDSYWADQLLAAKMQHREPDLLFASDKLLASVTQASIQKAAQRYLDQRNYVQLVVKPENMATTAQPELDIYKGNLPRNSGTKEISQAYLKTLTLSLQVIGAIKLEKFAAFIERSPEAIELVQLRDKLSQLKVSACLADAKQTQIALMDNLQQRIDTVVKTKQDQAAENSQLPPERRTQYLKLLTLGGEIGATIRAKLDRCDIGVE